MDVRRLEAVLILLRAMKLSQVQKKVDLLYIYVNRLVYRPILIYYQCTVGLRKLE